MNWSKASAIAAQTAQAWTREGGPGGAILLFDADDIRAEAFGGRASLEQDNPFRADTATRYASISKQFFTALLVQDGRIGLDDLLGKHIEVPAALAAVPVARALDMTAGIPDVVDTMGLLGAPPTATLDRHALLRFVRTLPGLNFPAGTEISYSNPGYRVLQAALDAKGTEDAASRCTSVSPCRSASPSASRRTKPIRLPISPPATGAVRADGSAAATGCTSRRQVG